LFGEAGAKTPYEVFYYYHQKQLQAVRSGPWKLFFPLGSARVKSFFKSKEKPDYLLFNVVEDIASENNVAAKHPEIVERLKRLADEARADLGDQGKQGAGQRPPGKVDNPVAQILKK
ncbi:MAG: arylsulfatase, partial [Verrucomicrobia bacterium]|nr:arylsulfatase [Verrucomicrobiota bacterium]